MFELLDTNLGGSEPSDFKASAADFLNQEMFTEEVSPLVILKEGEYDPRLLRTSYSGDLLLHGCPRKAQLKMLGAQATPDLEGNITFAFGHVVGDGIQQLLCGTPWEKVMMDTFIGWHADFFDQNEKQAKSLAEAIYCLMQFKSLMADGFLSEYEVAYFDGKPAAELSFRLHFPNTKYRGFVDLVLRHRYTGELMVLELKTTSAKYIRPSSYKNSAQALGYSVVLDKIDPGNTSYGVVYLCYMTTRHMFETFEFPKTYTQRSLWLRDRLWDEQNRVRLIQQEGNYGIWPMYGEHCHSFGRDCEFMDACYLSTERLMEPLREKHFKDLNRDTGEEQVYQFEITLAELIETQERLAEGQIEWTQTE